MRDIKKKAKRELGCSSVPAAGFHSSGSATQAAGAEKESMVTSVSYKTSLAGKPRPVQQRHSSYAGNQWF